MDTDRASDADYDVVPVSVRHGARSINSLNSVAVTAAAAIRQPYTTVDQLHADELPRSFLGRGTGQQNQRLPLDGRHVELDVECCSAAHVRVTDVGQRSERPGGLVARGSAVAPSTPTSVAARRRDASAAVHAGPDAADR